MTYLIITLMVLCIVEEGAQREIRRLKVKLPMLELAERLANQQRPDMEAMVMLNEMNRG